MKTPRRKTHPQHPLYLNESSGATPPPEVIDAIGDDISVSFPQVTGAIANAQVPESTVTQHEAAILASAALTGVPTAPTAAVATDTTQVATTAFVLANAGSGGGSLSRGDVTVITGSLADNATEAGVVTLGKSSLILRFTGSCACRIRLYSTSAYRTADATRAPGTDPIDEHGIMLDIVLPAGNLTWDLSPLAACTNDDTVPVSDIYYAIQNLSGVTQAVTATLTRLTLEP